jgi:hypothetical protein
MTTLFEILPYLNTYQDAFLGLAILALITLIQSFATAPLAFLKEESLACPYSLIIHALVSEF